MNAANHDRETVERARYLAATTDLSEQQALALAYREQGYTASAIARLIDSTEGTVHGYMTWIAAQYSLSATETKLKEERTDLEEVDLERVLALPEPVREDYATVAKQAPEHVPAAVLEEVLDE